MANLAGLQLSRRCRFGQVCCCCGWGQQKTISSVAGMVSPSSNQLPVQPLTRSRCLVLCRTYADRMQLDCSFRTWRCHGRRVSCAPLPAVAQRLRVLTPSVLISLTIHHTDRTVTVLSVCVCSVTRACTACSSRGRTHCDRRAPPPTTAAALRRACLGRTATPTAAMSAAAAAGPFTTAAAASTTLPTAACGQQSTRPRLQRHNSCCALAG